MIIPVEQSPARAEFFRAVARAFDFLSLFYSCTKQEQQEINEMLTMYEAKVAQRDSRNRDL